MGYISGNAFVIKVHELQRLDPIVFGPFVSIVEAEQALTRLGWKIRHTAWGQCLSIIAGDRLLAASIVAQPIMNAPDDLMGQKSLEEWQARTAEQEGAA